MLLRKQAIERCFIFPPKLICNLVAVSVAQGEHWAAVYRVLPVLQMLNAAEALECSIHHDCNAAAESFAFLHATPHSTIQHWLAIEIARKSKLLLRRTHTGASSTHI